MSGPGRVLEGRGRAQESRGQGGRGNDHGQPDASDNIAADEEAGSYYCIITSEQEMDDRDVIDANMYLFDHRTDLTDGLAGAVGIDLSRQVLRRGQVAKIMADVRKPRG